MTAAVQQATSRWWMLTPGGALRAFGQPHPGPRERALQALLGRVETLDDAAWSAVSDDVASLRPLALAEGWIEPLARPIEGPDTRLADFIQHVITGLSGRRQAVLASEAGFCLGRVGYTEPEAEVLSAAAADYSAFAARQARRGWQGAQRFVSFCSDPELLMPDTSFVPFWVDGIGYWLVLAGEPLLNNPALVELLWGIQTAGNRFRSTAREGRP